MSDVYWSTKEWKWLLTWLGMPSTNTDTRSPLSDLMRNPLLGPMKPRLDRRDTLTPGVP